MEKMSVFLTEFATVNLPLPKVRAKVQGKPTYSHGNWQVRLMNLSRGSYIIVADSEEDALRQAIYRFCKMVEPKAKFSVRHHRLSAYKEELRCWRLA